MANNKTDAWYPMYPADYLKDTLDLTLEEDAFYTRALNQVYINKGRIPAEPERLQRLLRVNRVQYNRCKWVLAKYFYKADDGYGNRRADIEISKAQERAEVARENGRKSGGRPRKNPGETQSVISGLPYGFGAGNPDNNPEKSSSQSQSEDPPYPPSEFQNVKPRLFEIFRITQPSMRDENAMYEFWIEIRTKKATLEQVEEKASQYRDKFPKYAFTPNAVLRNWHSLADPAPEYSSLQPEFRIPGVA